MSLDASTVVAQGIEHGVFAALRVVAEQPIADVADMYSDAMRLAYWERKDLTLAVGFAVGGVSRLLAEASTAAPDAAYDLRSRVKALVCDYASFSWIDWDEDGNAISANEAVAGLGAARMNLTLATELGKGQLAESRAHWMIGAHLLTGGDPVGASSSFATAQGLAERR